MLPDELTTSQVEDEPWDCLIILDACRFDYFSQQYSGYFTGKLTKRISRGSNTPDWFANTFKHKHSDVIYISGNPFINGTSNSKLEAVRIFSKVIDAWDLCWNEALGTVLPQEINKVALKTMQDFPSCRFIIHYLQPHAPYISTRFQTRGFTKPIDKTKGSNLFLLGNDGSFERRLCRYADSFGTLLTKIGVLDCKWAIRDLLGMPPASPMDATRRQYGMEGVRSAYEENLAIVFQHVQHLCRYLLANKPEMRIVVTSDHGERLGDNRQYSHESGSNDPMLREVPWLEVSGLADQARNTK